MRKFTSKHALAAGVAAACAVVALWPQPTPPSAGQSAGAGAGAGAGAAPLATALTERTASWRADPRAVEAAAVPQTPAQAKLGGGQLLQAVSWFNQRRSVAIGSAATVALQIAALDRAGLPARYREGEKVKVNLRLALSPAQSSDSRRINQATTALRDALHAAGVQARIIPGSPALEASVPLARLESVAQWDQVAAVALMAMPTLSSVVSGGLARSGTQELRVLGLDAASVPQDLRRELNGEGTTVAIIDGFTASTIAALQDSGDWPKSSADAPNKLVLIPPAGGQAFGAGDEDHGNAVTEIVHDFAPNASYRLYDLQTSGVAEIVDAVQDAAGLDRDNVRQNAPRAQVINMSLGFSPGDSPGDGTGGSGELRGLYEALAAARDNGVLIVEATGNVGGQYWDGDSTPAPVASTAQDFDPSNRDANGAPIDDDVEVLHFQNPALGDCLSVGVNNPLFADFLTIRMKLAWNDWSAQDRLTSVDYRLELVRWADEVTREVDGRTEVVRPAGWVLAAQSDSRQSGMAGDEPTEFIAYVPPATDRTRRCDAIFPPPATPGQGFDSGGGIFGVRIVRKTPGGANFLRLSLAGTLYWPTHEVDQRTIGPPADSPHVLAVGAVGADGKILDFSSQGPVLGPGGARPLEVLPDPNPKPNFVSFSRVATQTSGPDGFGGTSAAAPHVAGFTLLSLQYQRLIGMNNARWGSQDLAWRALPDHAALAESTLVGTLLPAVDGARFGAEHYRQRFPELLLERRQDLASATVDSMVGIAQTNSDMNYDYQRGKGLLRFARGADNCFLATLYDWQPRYRRWLTPLDPQMHAGVPQYDVPYSQYHTMCLLMRQGRD